MISWALCKVTIDLALHSLHNQHRSISDHIYKVDNTHDNQRTNGPVNAHLISWPSKVQNIHNLENIW